MKQSAKAKKDSAYDGWDKHRGNFLDAFWNHLENNKEGIRASKFLIDVSRQKTATMPKQPPSSAKKQSKKKKSKTDETQMHPYDRQKLILQGSFFEENWIAPSGEKTSRDNVSTNLACALEMLRDCALLNPRSAAYLRNLMMDPDPQKYPQGDIELVKAQCRDRFQTMEWVRTFLLRPLEVVRKVYSGKLNCERLIIEKIRTGKDPKDLKETQISEGKDYNFHEWDELINELGSNANRTTSSARGGPIAIQEVSKKEFNQTSSSILQRLVTLFTIEIFQDMLQTLKGYGYDPVLPDHEESPRYQAVSIYKNK